MGEQETDRLAVVRSPTSLRQRCADIYRLNLVASLFLLRMRHGIRHNQTTQTAIIQIADSVARENGVGHDGIDFLCAVLYYGVGCLDEGAACISHVVHDDGDFVFDVADEDHAGDFVGARALFVDQCELEVEAVGDCGCSISMSVNHHTRYLRYVSSVELNLLSTASSLSSCKHYTARWLILASNPILLSVNQLCNQKQS